MRFSHSLPVLLLVATACAGPHSNSPYDQAKADCARQAHASASQLSAGSGDLAAQANRTAYHNALQTCLATRGYIGQP